MLDNLVLIENGKYYQFSTEDELIKKLLGNNYYSLSKKEKNELMKLNATINCFRTNLEILTIPSKEERTYIKNKFIIYDEKSYILSLLLTNKITLLEKKESNIYTNNLNKANFNDNYVIVNNFAEELLKFYMSL